MKRNGCKLDLDLLNSSISVNGAAFRTFQCRSFIVKAGEAVPEYSADASMTTIHKFMAVYDSDSEGADGDGDVASEDEHFDSELAQPGPVYPQDHHDYDEETAVCIYIYICICVYIYIYIYMCAHTYIYAK